MLELVIVIAVLAILVAVLIPTFSAVFRSARQAGDVEICRQMNDVLIADESLNGKANDIKKIYTLLNAAGLNGELTPRNSDCVFIWVSYTNRVYLVRLDEENAENPLTVIYPEVSENADTRYDAGKMCVLGDLTNDETFEIDLGVFTETGDDGTSAQTGLFLTEPAASSESTDKSEKTAEESTGAPAVTASAGQSSVTTTVNDTASEGAAASTQGAEASTASAAQSSSVAETRRNARSNGSTFGKFFAAFGEKVAKFFSKLFGW